MTIDVRKSAAWIVLALILIAAPAQADVLSEMNRFWQGAAVNTTGPTAFQGQASGHWTLGNLYLRSPVRSEQVATVNLPSFRAGCGGIDAFAGAFSFINSDQLVAFGRAVAQNAAGFAFELALETISPVIAETMAKLRALAQWVNAQNLNSCETAQALVGAAWSKNDRASASICAAIGTSQGIFSDYAAAKHGCGADGKRNSTLASASGAMADQVPVNVNYAWKAIRASSFLSGDTQLAEFAMAVTGTVIVTAPTSDGDVSGPRVRILEPLALDRRVTETLMEGGGQLPVYRCDTTAACLNPTLGTAAVPANRGFRARVAALLRDMVDAVRTDTAVPAPALALVNLTTLPVYRVANAAAAYRGAVIDQEMDALAEAVALDVMQVWLSDLHRTVEERAGTLDIADGEQLTRWREGLRANRVALARHRNEGLARFNTALAVVEKLRLIETELAGALSADLRAALAFASGGAGAGSPLSHERVTPCRESYRPDSVDSRKRLRDDGKSSRGEFALAVLGDVVVLRAAPGCGSMSTVSPRMCVALRRGRGSLRCRSSAWSQDSRAGAACGSTVGRSCSPSRLRSPPRGRGRACRPEVRRRSL